MADEPKNRNPMTAFDAESSCSSEDEDEVAPPVKKDNGLAKFAKEIGIGGADTKPLLCTLRRIRSVDEAFNERLTGLDTGYCDIDRKHEMKTRRIWSEDIKKKREFLIVVLKEIEAEFAQRGFTKGQKIEEFNKIYADIAVKQMRPALIEGVDLPLKKFEVDLYVMTGMMFGLFRGDEDYRFGSLLGLADEQFAKRGFHTDAEYYMMNEQTQKTNEGQALKRKIADEDEELRKAREKEEQLAVEKELEEQNDREICDMLDALQFSYTDYICRMQYEGLTADEASRICKAEATKRRIDAEEARYRLPVSSPPRSEVDASEWRDVDLVEDDLANLNVQTGPSQADLYALIDKNGFFAQPDDCEPVDMDISFDERDAAGERQEVPDEGYEPTEEEIAAREKAINSMRNHARAQEQPDSGLEIERYQRMRAERRAPSPVFGQPVHQPAARGWPEPMEEEEQEPAHYRISQPVQQSVARGRPEYRYEEQERAHYRPQYGDGRGEEADEGDRSPHYEPSSPQYEPSSPQYEPTSPIYGSPTYGSPRYGDDRNDEQAEHESYRGDEPVGYLPQHVQQRLTSDLERRLQLVQQQQLQDPRLQDPRLRDRRDPQDPRRPQDPRPHHNELSAREIRERERFVAEQQKRAAYEAEQAARAAAAQHAMDEDDVEVIGVNIAGLASRLRPYKQRLSSDQMKQMTRARAEFERKKWEAPTEFAKIGGCGQTDLRDDFLVPLDDKFEGALRSVDRPKVRVDYGVRLKDKKKSILRLKNIGNAKAPALITDLHADKMPFPATAEGVEMRKQLLRVQRFNAEKPRKTVKFADEKDERNKIRLYIMQADQERTRRPIVYDATDDGYTRFHVTKQLCWQQDTLLPYAKSHTDRRFTPDMNTLTYRSVAGSCSTLGWFRNDPQRRDNHYLWQPLAVRVAPEEDPIFTRKNAKMSPGQERDPDYIELTVSQRDYKIMRAMKPMEDLLIEERWLPQLRLFTAHAFGCELSRAIGTHSPANSGLSYLVFTDSLLDRVNTYRFPQTHFVIHQKPLNLSTSFRVLCDEIPFEKLLNIECFVFAYGFDEILFGGEDPRVVASTVMTHCVAVANLVHQARAALRHSHRYTIVPKYRIMKLPLHLMDDRLQRRLRMFNDYLVEIMHEFSRQSHMEQFCPIQLLDWETEEIIRRTIKEVDHFVERGKYRYNCVESFAVSMQKHLNMQTLRLYPKHGDHHEFHQRRMMVSGLSEKVFKENY